MRLIGRLLVMLLKSGIGWILRRRIVGISLGLLFSAHRLLIVLLLLIHCSLKGCERAPGGLVQPERGNVRKDGVKGSKGQRVKECVYSYQHRGRESDKTEKVALGKKEKKSLCGQIYRGAQALFVLIQVVIKASPAADSIFGGDNASYFSYSDECMG